jgi:outer membrane protein OmpA-like peptidoglycan-associated protein
MLDSIPRRRKKRLSIIVTTAIMISTTGCMTNMQKTWDENGGKIVGGLAGAAIGAIACKGDAVCIAAGALAGVTLGALWDQRQQDLIALAKKENIKIETTKVETFNESGQTGLETTINPGEMFGVGSAELTAGSKRKFEAIAGIYKNKPQKILVIGHTDATGSEQSNIKLSEKRAQAVAKLLADQGIPKDSVFYQGAGEAQPIATNDTATGRADNRRVEIIEVDSIQSIAAYSLQRKSDNKFISNSTKTKKEKEQIEQQVKVAAKKPIPVSKKVEPKLLDVAAAEKDINTELQTTVNTKAKVDFSGKPAQQDISALLAAAGEQVDNSFSFFSTAHAADVLPPCFLDSPRIVGAVQNLANNQPLDPEKVLNLKNYKQSDYWPGANGNVWMDTVNGNLVALKDLRILEKSGGVIGQPETLIYTDYAKGNKKLNYKMPAYVETYKGTDGLLVRSYFKADSPLQCMDFVLANKSVTQARAGTLYYETSNGLYEQAIQPHRIK